MNIKIENGFWGMVRVLVIATLLLLVVGAAPVDAAVYQVTTPTPAVTMRYICEDKTDLSKGYYAISTADELQTFAGIVNKTVMPDGVTVILNTGDAVASPTPANLSTNAKMTGDIDLSNVCGATKGNWSPIGSDYSNKSYIGTFDGQGYTVNHLYISAATSQLGLFGFVKNGTIKNLTVAGSITGVGQIGGIAGTIFDTSTIDNCCSQVAISGSLQQAGGIVGSAKNSSTIKNCRNQVAINGTGNSRYIGGIVGYLEKSTVVDCENSAAITGSYTVGGIAGTCSGSSAACSVTNASNTAAVKATVQGVGGIAANASGNVKIANCYNTGHLEDGGSSDSYAGGIVGFTENNNSSVNPTVVKNCYNTGSIQATTSNTGTLVGKIVVVDNGVVDVSACYWLDSLTQTAIGSTFQGTGTPRSSFSIAQGQAAIGTVSLPSINTETGKCTLADALNVGQEANQNYSTWKVDTTNGGYPVFDSGGYTAVMAPAISVQPTDLSPNPGDSFTLSLTAIGAGTVTSYQWYRLETNSATLGGTAIASATDSTYTTSPAVLGSYYYYCLGTATVNGITATTRSNTVPVTVQPEASWVLSDSTDPGSGTLADAVVACNNNANGGTITLNKSLTLASTITINKNITLLSAGVNKITRGNALKQSDMFTVSDGAILTLGSTNGMSANNTLTLDGGADWKGTIDPILGRGTTNSGISSAHSIIYNQGTLNMHSGVTIQNNANDGTYSASMVAVYNHPAAADKTATFNIDGGVITRNYGCEAGAIYNDGFPVAVDKTILNISGGRIEGNQSILDSHSGNGTGGIKNYGTFTLSGMAVIAGNKGTCAGGVDAGWKMTMTGGTITGNEGNYCGGIGQSYSVMSQLFLSGGTITGNNATGDDTNGNTAGGLLPSKVSASTFSISGNPKVTGNTVGGTISQANGVYTTTGGTHANMGLMNTTDYKTPVFIKGELTSGAAIGVSLLSTGSTDVVPALECPVIVVIPGTPVMDASSYLTNFSSDNSSYDMAVKEKNLVLAIRTKLTISDSITSRVYNGQPIVAADPVIKKAGTEDVVVAIVKEELTYLYTSADGKGYSNTAAPTNAGAYQLVISVPVGNLDYSGSSAEIPFTINPKPVTVTGQNFTINVGADAPIYQFNADGLVSDESLTNVILNCTYLKNDSIKGIAGTYPIVPSGGTMGNNNYLLSFIPGTLTVNANSSGGGGGGGYTPPGIPGVVVTPGTITFDPTGNLAVDITGAPAGSVVYYSLDGITFTTTPPAMENAGEHKVYVKITCPGYQDYTTQTTVIVEKHEAPVIPELSLPVTGGQQSGSTDLGTLLPTNRGETHFRLGPFSDPRGILSEPPTVDQLGHLTYGFLNPLSANGEQVTASAETTALTATITVLVSMENYEDTTINVIIGDNPAIGIRYQTHIQDIGWENDWTTDGNLSGTFGQSKRLEALKVELTGDVPVGATIDTAVHVQNQGNLGPFAMGTAAGTSGLGLRLENICLTLNNLPGYTLLYNVHVQNQGWLRDEADSNTWFESGETAGTSALSLRLEGIRIKLVKSE